MTLENGVHLAQAQDHRHRELPELDIGKLSADRDVLIPLAHHGIAADRGGIVDHRGQSIDHLLVRIGPKVRTLNHQADHFDERGCKQKVAAQIGNLEHRLAPSTKQLTNRLLTAVEELEERVAANLAKRYTAHRRIVISQPKAKMAERQLRHRLIVRGAVRLLADVVERIRGATKIVGEEVQVNAADLIHKHRQLPGRIKLLRLVLSDNAHVLYSLFRGFG